MLSLTIQSNAFFAYSVNGKQMCVNIYDVRYEDLHPACGLNWPADIKPITTYLDVGNGYHC